MSSELRWALERLMEAAELDDMPPGLAQARNQARKALDASQPAEQGDVERTAWKSCAQQGWQDIATLPDDLPIGTVALFWGRLHVSGPWNEKGIIYFTPSPISARFAR